MSTENLRKQKFIVDKMYKKLVRWLRILGYDTKFDSEYDDIDLIQIAKAEDRVVISRDEDLIRRCTKLGITAIRTDGKSIEERLSKLQKETGIDLTLSDDILSRCTVCNSQIKSVKKEDIKDRILEGTKKHHKDFWICTNDSCQQIFWRGPHWEKIAQTLKLCAEQK